MERGSAVRACRPVSIRCLTAKVLVIDDDQDFRALARELLEQAGMEVIEAADGCRCLQKAPLDVDVVIVDMVMPDQDGIATLCLLKHRLLKAKFIAISGAYESSVFLGISARLGASAILHKSDVAGLPALVNRLLDS